MNKPWSSIISSHQCLNQGSLWSSWFCAWLKEYETKILHTLKILSENVQTNVAWFMKMIVLRFFHLSQVDFSSVITSSFTRSPQRQSELSTLRTCEGGGRRHSLPVHGLATSSCCHISQWLLVSMSMDALGREGTSFPQDTAGGVRKGDRRRSCKKTFPSQLVATSNSFGRTKQRKHFLLWLLPLWVTAVWLQSCSDNYSPLLCSTGSQPLQLLTLDQIWG